MCLLMGEGVACGGLPSRALVVLYRMLTIFACYVLTYVWDAVSILNHLTRKFAPKGPINNIPALVQIMAWRRQGDKPLSEPMLIFAPTHICVTRPQWLKYASDGRSPSPWFGFLFEKLYEESWAKYDLTKFSMDSLPDTQNCRLRMLWLVGW